MAVDVEEREYELLNGAEMTGEQYTAADARTAADAVMASLPLVPERESVVENADEYALTFGLLEPDTDDVHVYEGWAWKHDGELETYVQPLYTMDIATYRERGPDAIDTVPWCE